MACCWSFWGRRRLRARDVELTRVGPLGRGGPGVDLPSSASPSSLSCITCLLCRLVLLGLFVGQQHRAGWTRSGETRRSSREARGRGELAEPQDGSRLCRGQGAGSQHHIRRKDIRSTFKPRGKFLPRVQWRNGPGSREEDYFTPAAGRIGVRASPLVASLLCGRLRSADRGVFTQLPRNRNPHRVFVTQLTLHGRRISAYRTQVGRPLRALSWGAGLKIYDLRFTTRVFRPTPVVFAVPRSAQAF